MANKDKQAERWKEARARCRMSDEAIKMAKEMRLNPLSLIKNAPNKTQLWKAPVAIVALRGKVHTFWDPRAYPGTVLNTGMNFAKP